MYRYLGLFASYCSIHYYLYKNDYYPNLDNFYSNFGIPQKMEEK